MTTAGDCLAHLTAHPEVVGIGRCGSYRQGTADTVSDLDLWVFCADDTPLSTAYALQQLLPAGARPEILFEGEDDTRADQLVINLLTDPVVNLKFLRTAGLADFCQQTPSLDPLYLENLENYHAMELLHDPGGVIEGHRAVMRRRAVDTTGQWLVPEIAARYSSVYWRSVYQGVLRDERHSWRLLATSLVEYLVWMAFLNAGQLPPARKWLFSPALLATVPHGPRATALLDLLHDAADQTATLGFYRELTAAENLVLADTELERGLWWRKVFTHRLPNLAQVTGRADLNHIARTAPAVALGTEAAR